MRWKISTFVNSVANGLEVADSVNGVLNGHCLLIKEKARRRSREVVVKGMDGREASSLGNERLFGSPIYPKERELC